MTAYAFVVKSIDTGRTVAHAVVAHDARYCGVLNLGDDRVTRKFLQGSAWLAIEQQLGERLEAGPLEATSAVVRSLAGDQAAALSVQYLMSLPIDVPPAEVAAALDALLRGLAAVPLASMRQEHQS